MKVGILVECGREGLEDVMMRRICTLLQQEHGEPSAFEIVPMDNKARLIRDSGAAVANLLRDGCDKVVILWDERPAWPDRRERLCWHEDRQHILASLQANQVETAYAKLICIEREFESWLLFDEPMLSRVLSREAHPVKVSAQRNPDRIKNPKGAMRKLFREHGGGCYNDVQLARRLAASLLELNRLRKCSTFVRFEQVFEEAARARLERRRH